MLSAKPSRLHEFKPQVFSPFSQMRDEFPIFLLLPVTSPGALGEMLSRCQVLLAEVEYNRAG